MLRMINDAGMNDNNKRSSRKRISPERSLPAWSTSNPLDTCDQLITHDYIRALYDIPFPDAQAKVSPNNTMNVFLLSSAYAQSDLDMFFSSFTPCIANDTAAILKSLNGGNAAVDYLRAEAEANTDLQLAIPLIHPQQVVAYQADDDYWSAKQMNEVGMFDTFLDAIDGIYCTYEAYGEKGDNPEFDPGYPDESEGGYNGERMCGTYKVSPKFLMDKRKLDNQFTLQPTNMMSISYMKSEPELLAANQKRQVSFFLK